MSLRNSTQKRTLASVDSRGYYSDRHSGSQKPSLLTIILRHIVFWQFLLAGLLAILAAGMAFSGPLVIKEILNYLKLKTPTTQQSSNAYMFTGVWIVLYLCRIFISEYAERLMFNQAVKTEQVMSLQIFEKLMRLSPAYRLHTDKGELLNYINVDTKLAFSFMKSCTTLFAAPVTLVVVQGFLVKQVGVYGWVLLGVLALAGGLQVYLNRRMSVARNKKLSILTDRVNCNIELVSGIREVKALGWQQLLIDKNTRYRKQENKFNRSYFNLSNLFDLTINVTPALTVLLVFLLKLMVENNPDLDTAQVYTVLAFVGMTFGPTKSLLTTIVGAMDGVAAIRRVEHFLEAEEIGERSNFDSNFPEGRIEIKEALLSWQTQQSEEHFKKKATVIQETESELDERRSESRSQLEIPMRKAIETSLNTSIMESLQAQSPNKFMLAVPTSLIVKPGDRIILMSESDGGKTSFFHALMGNLSLVSGRISYGGKIGYLPQKLWFRKTTVRENILFGMEYNQRKLGQIYRTVLLKDELPLLSHGDLTQMKDLSHLTQSQKRRIALARVLYHQPDIMLLDQVFASMDQETAKHLYENLRQSYPNTTIILSTHATNIVEGDDIVMLFKKGMFKEIGRYRELLAKKESYIHELLEIDDREHQQHSGEQQATQKLIVEEQKAARRLKMEERRKKLQKFVRQLIAASRTMPKEQLEQIVHAPEQTAVPANPAPLKKVEAPKRLEGVPIKMFGLFLSSAPIILTVLLCT